MPEGSDSDRESVDSLRGGVSANPSSLEAWFMREVWPLEAVLMQYLRQNWRNQSAFLQRQVRNQPLQPRILFLKVLHLARLIQIQTAIFLTPAEITLFRDARFPACNRYRFSLRRRHLDLAQQRHKSVQH